MRPFETLLFLANLLTFFVLAVPVPRTAGWVRYSALFTLLIAATQLLIEGPRWQMGPAYALAGLLFLVGMLQKGASASRYAGQTRTHRLAVGLAIGAGVLALTVSVALPIFLPIFHFPKPTGPYQIGTVTNHLVDTSRHEIFSADPNAHRELMVQIWYPVQKIPNATYAPYLQSGTNLAPSARFAHLPWFFFDHLKYVKTNAILSGPMVQGDTRFPVLIFSPGRSGYRQNNNFQVEELVSHGYVVAAIDHPYTVGDVAFPDGRHVEFDKRVANSVLDERIGENTFMLNVYDNLGQDAVFVLDQLSKLNQADPNRILTDRLDLQHVGIFGSSLGGITAAEACRLDHRFRACLILDVAMPPDMIQSGLRQPAMWISRGPENTTRGDEGWTPSSAREHYTTMRAVFSSLPGDGYLVYIPGMYHLDITDLPYIVPPPVASWLDATGPMHWRETHSIINDYSLAFFDRYLKGIPSLLLDGPSKRYPVVFFEKRYH